MADDRELRLKVRVDDQASRPLDRIGDAADEAKGDFEDLNQGLKKLDDKVKDTTKTLADLRAEVARSGDLDLLKDITKQEQRLKALERQRRSLVGDGGREAEQFALSFSQRIGPLLASAPVSPPLAGAFAATVPIVSSLISAAVTSGVAVAVTGAGVKLAFQHPAVKAAADGLKTEIGNSLKDAAKPFVPETIKAIGIVRGEFRALRPEIDGLFRDSARYVQPLTRAVVGFAREVIPGLRDANREAGPLVETLGEHGPRAGRAFGDALRSLSSESAATAQQLDGLLTSIEGVTIGVGKMIEWGSKVGLLGSPVMAWVGTLGDADAKAREAADAARVLAMEQAKVVPPILSAAEAARQQTSALAGLADRMRAQTDPMFALIDAQRGLSAAQGDYNATVAEHGRQSPQAQDALRRVAQAALTLQGATGAAAGSFDGQLTPAMRSTLKAAKLTDGQIASLEAQFKDAKVAGDRFAKTYQATVKVTYQGLQKDFIGPVSPTSPWGQNRWGGVYEHAQDGLIKLREPGIYSATMPARYAFAEPATGGEAFIPRFGDRSRSLAILDKAASWYGAQLAPRSTVSGTSGSGGSGAPVAVLEIRSGGSAMDDLLVEILRRAVWSRGGDVQMVLGREG